MTTNDPNLDPASEPVYPAPGQAAGAPHDDPYANYYGAYGTPYGGAPYGAPYGAPPSGASYGAPYAAYPGGGYADPNLPPYADPNLAGYPPPGGYWTPPAPPAKRRPGWRLGAGVAALTAAALVGGVVIGDAVSGGGSTTATGSGSDGQLAPTVPGGLGSGNSGELPGSSGQLPGTSSGGTSTSVTLANGKQKVGVVTIVSTLKYENSQSAGTGMILTSNGEVLTNNHVVSGATSIVVTVASTGKSYRADVVGTAPTKDVAVLQLRDASGLKTANLADKGNDVKVGESVVGVGNAGGTGMLRASSGSVTALGQTITASDDGSGANAERLSGLIEVNAPIISGDSGGPLYDAAGEIVGMDTAASADPTQTKAYAIPIQNAVSVADQIEAGHESSTIHIGLPAFLGVSISSTATSPGALVESLLDGGPAADAGVTAGSVITKVGGTKITTGAGLKTALQKYEPGERVTITWTDAAGASHSSTVTLATGPAD